MGWGKGGVVLVVVVKEKEVKKENACRLLVESQKERDH
jgi:hypothetical protein